MQNGIYVEIIGYFLLFSIFSGFFGYEKWFLDILYMQKIIFNQKYFHLFYS